MQTTIRKTTKTTITTTWEGTVTDDSGKPIAKMTGSLSANSPLGNTNLIVMNTAKYAECADEIKAAYADFQTNVQEAAEQRSPSGSVTETIE